MKRRGSGILLHISSLPSRFGIGDLGPGAHQFLEFLAETGQDYWQVLPLNPTRIRTGNSPYSSPSAFAGNPLFISPEVLAEEGLISRSALKRTPRFSDRRVDYPSVVRLKNRLFRSAFESFRRGGESDFLYRAMVHENRNWLEDFSVFEGLKAHFNDEPWNRWPRPFRDRKQGFQKGLNETFRRSVDFERFLQYLFFKQWGAFKAKANDLGIQIIGDVPIYVSLESADVWSNPSLFKLDERKRPAWVAGVPPDFFSATGQLWGNPIYRWDVLKETGYRWWVRRIAHQLKWFDMIRLDHFQGLVNFWEVPASEKTAVRGRWVRGPREDLFNALLRHLPSIPFIAEDLGVITAEVNELRDRFEFPGMRVLQFAFGTDPLADLYKPHHYVPNAVAYTGTHDNDTLIGWLRGGREHSVRPAAEIQRERRAVLRYLGLGKTVKKDIHWELIRILMMSAANGVILPLQDVLGLGREARMNRPGVSRGNWEWRMPPRALTPSVIRRLKDLTELSGRT